VEAAIQRALVKWIPAEVHVIATLNEDSRHKLTMGVDVGCPDLLLFYRGRSVLHVFFLELKTKTGSMRYTQKEWAEGYLANLQSINTSYATAYGLEEAQGYVEAWLEQLKS